MNKVIKIGIIGTNFGGFIAKNFKALDPLVDISIVGKDHKKTQLLANEIGVNSPYKTWEEMVEDSSIDLICIVTPHDTHLEIFQKCIENNKNILLDKPVEYGLEKIKKMAKMIEGYEKFVYVNHEARFNPVSEYFRKAIADNRIGNISSLRINAYLNGWSNKNQEFTWFHEKTRGGGQIQLMGTHLIDLALYILDYREIVKGSIQTVVTQNSHFGKEITADTQFSAHFKTKDNIGIQFFNDSYCQGYKDFEIQLIGSEGIILYSDSLGLRESFSNDEPLDKIDLGDNLKSINFSKSFVSGSFKYLAKELLSNLRGDSYKEEMFCTVQQALNYSEYLYKYKDD